MGFQKTPRTGSLVLIADDHEMVRKGMRLALASRGAVEIHEAGNGIEAVQKANELKPDVVILDISMPLLDGLSAAREIRKTAPDTPILIFSLNRTEAFVEVAKRIGVSGYLSKTQDSTTFLQAVEALLRGGTFFLL